MDNIKGAITGTIITLVIGGAAYTFSQEDVVNNLAADTGLSQEQASEYVTNIPEDELVSWDEIGSALVAESKDTFAIVSDLDCDLYEYEWESNMLTCEKGKSQLMKIGASERATGEAFLNLSSDSASEDDIRATITLLDELNANYKLEISIATFDAQAVEEMTMTNSYNKAVLKAALESN